MWDDDDTDREISDGYRADPGQSILLSDIEEDNLDNQPVVLHFHQAHHDKTIWTTRVPLPKRRSRTDTVIARTSLPHLRHPAEAIAPPLLKRQKSTINISCQSDIVPAQELPLAKAGGDKNVLQRMASGDHNVPQHQKSTVEVPKWFMEAIVFTQTAWPIIPDQKCSLLDEAWTLAIEAQDRQWALAGAHVGTPSVCQLPCSPSLKIDPQTQEAVSVYSVFCSSIGHMMILNPTNMQS